MKSRRGYYDMLLRSCALHHSRIAVRHLHDGRYHMYTYSELYGVCECVSQHLQLLRCASGVVGILTHRNPLVPAVIAAVHKNSPTFMFLDPTKDNSHIMTKIKFQAIIAMHYKDELFKLTTIPDKEICLYNIIIKFYKSVKNLGVSSVTNEEENSFIMTTSGSTGEPKQVKVPIQCIQPNIDDLIKMFNITCNDVVYFSTPLTFDPSMVEMLLASACGASLLLAPITTDVVSQQSEHAVTVWQTTPSIFFQFSNEDIARILSAKSKLKILAFGGEPFNQLKRLKELKNERNLTRIFCLYGVTELSCWACAIELQLDSMVKNEEIPLGTCLSETKLRIFCHDKDRNFGNIHLGSSTRKCKMQDKPSSPFTSKRVRWLDTGDVGEYKNGTVYYRGRSDDIIKRFGHKVNLQLLEKTVLLCPQVKVCSCLWLPKPHLLMLYYTSDSLTCDGLEQFLRNHLDDKTWPDKIMRFSSLPLNNHGKICKSDLAAKVLQDIPKDLSENLKTTLMKELRLTLKLKSTYNEIKDKDYFSIGGTSFLAVSMCNKLAACYPQLNCAILPSLLTPNISIENILKTLQIESTTKAIMHSPKVKKRRTPSQTSSPIAERKAKRKLSTVLSVVDTEIAKVMELWSFNMMKCVDATPTLFKTDETVYLAVGSHSGNVVVLNAKDGSVCGQLELRARVEAAVHCFQCKQMTQPCGVVGTYDGTIICFALHDCNLIWKISVDAMIKSKATVANNTLYVASYDGILRCINSMTGVVISEVRLSQHGISSDLISIGDRLIVVCTLDGVCTGVSTDSNVQLWCRRFGSPIFAAPVSYKEMVLIAEVRGVVHCLSAEDGRTICKYTGAEGNIYSSLSTKANSTEAADFDVIFGCHDCNLYCLNITNNKVKLNWKTKTTSPIYSTPCYFTDKVVLASTVKGRLHVIESSTGRVLSEYRMPGDTFSTPTVLEDQVFIGCRDDHVYSLKCTVHL